MEAAVGVGLGEACRQELIAAFCHAAKGVNERPQKPDSRRRLCRRLLFVVVLCGFCCIISSHFTVTFGGTVRSNAAATAAARAAI